MQGVVNFFLDLIERQKLCCGWKWKNLRKLISHPHQNFATFDQEKDIIFVRYRERGMRNGKKAISIMLNTLNF
jgi:hypothetical protein